MPRNIVVVVLDSVRYDYFQSHGQGLLEAADISLSQCRAASNWSPPSHGALVTGQLPSESGIHSHDPSYDDVPVESTFFDALSEYYTIGVSGNLFVSESYGFDRYFDSFTNISRDAVFARGGNIDSMYNDIESDGIGRYLEFLKRAMAQESTTLSIANGLALKLNDVLASTPVPRVWDFGTRTSLNHLATLIEDKSDRPVFGFVNLMETHNPHANNVFYRAEGVPNSWSSSRYNTYEFNNHVLRGEADQEHAEHYDALYRESIEYVDRLLVPFFERVQAATDRETTFVVTADHGENLCRPTEDGLLGHIGNLSEALLHVPLLLFNSPETISEPETGYFSHLDFRELIAGLAEDKLDIRFRDRLPVEVVGSAPPDGIDNYEHWDRMQRAVYDGDTKYVWDATDRTSYRIDRDQPCSQTTIDSEWPDDLEASWFQTPISEYKGQFGDAETKSWGEDAPVDQLKELGYL